MLLPVETLRPHEETEPDRAAELVETLRSDGYIEEPIVVDSRHRVILDGHHRYEALRRLGCQRIPAYLVDYGSPAVRVTLWDGADVEAVTKDDVLRRAGDGELFPPKTTRHRFDAELPRRMVPLDELG